MRKINSIQLSRWIIHNLPELNYRKNELTHLKLQKLSYYCYGISLAKGFENYFEKFTFEAWKHGPVSRKIYEEFNSFGASEIEKDLIEKPEFELPKELESLLLNVLYLYGSLNPWKIRQQSHLEAPWIKAFNEENILDNNEIRNCFIQKYFQKSKRIIGPEYVFDLSSFKLDGIPIVGFASFDELVDAAKNIYFRN